MDLKQATFHSYLKPLIKYGFVENQKIENSKEKELKLTSEGIDKAGETTTNFDEIDFRARVV